MYPLASTAGLRKNNVQVELVVGILPAHSRIHIVDGTLVKNATSIRPEHIAFVCIAEGLLLITPPDAGIPATADTSTGLRRIGAFGAIGQMCQVVDALCDTVGVGEVTPALDLLALHRKLGHFTRRIKAHVSTVVANLQLCGTGAYPRAFDSPPQTRSWACNELP